jgi:hypothetical protein
MSTKLNLRYGSEKGNSHMEYEIGFGLREIALVFDLHKIGREEHNPQPSFWSRAALIHASKCVSGETPNREGSCDDQDEISG